MRKFSIIVFVNLIVAFFLMELALNIYNPFGFRLKGNNIILENNTIRHLITNNKEIIHTKNSLGLRGPELVDNESVKIISIGGSTTENFYHDDSKTWSQLFNNKFSVKINKSLWVNNAGLDGHSTFGHIKLIVDYIIKIKPDVIIFLIGANDVGLNKENSFDIVYDFSFDKLLIVGNQRYLARNLVSFLATKSEFFSLLVNLYRYYIKTEYSHIYRNPPDHTMQIDYQNDGERNSIYPFSDFIKEYNLLKDNSLPQYSERIIKIIDLSNKYNFKPIFMTQPTIHGIDAEDNFQKKKISAGDKFYLNLELYNNKLRDISKRYQIDLIDLAILMPKNENFYNDKIHLTGEGLEHISDIVTNYFVNNCELIFDNNICK